MKKYLLLALVLSGCATDPAGVVVRMQFPKAPADLLQTCPDLKKIDAKADKLSTALSTVVDNYSQYYECKAKDDAWIEWYQSQAKIYNGVK